MTMTVDEISFETEYSMLTMFAPQGTPRCSRLPYVPQYFSRTTLRCRVTVNAAPGNVFALIPSSTNASTFENAFRTGSSSNNDACSSFLNNALAAARLIPCNICRRLMDGNSVTRFSVMWFDALCWRINDLFECHLDTTDQVTMQRGCRV